MSSTLRRSLPPLNALRAFEAAARHLSLSLAANELNVTPAAISHQVRLLEEHSAYPYSSETVAALLSPTLARQDCPICAKRSHAFRRRWTRSSRSARPARYPSA